MSHSAILLATTLPSQPLVTIPQPSSPARTPQSEFEAPSQRLGKTSVVSSASFILASRPFSLASDHIVGNRASVSMTSEELPPSPPLTRVPTDGSGRSRRSTLGGDQYGLDKDGEDDIGGLNGNGYGHELAFGTRKDGSEVGTGSERHMVPSIHEIESSAPMILRGGAGEKDMVEDEEEVVLSQEHPLQSDIEEEKAVRYPPPIANVGSMREKGDRTVEFANASRPLSRESRRRAGLTVDISEELMQKSPTNVPFFAIPRSSYYVGPPGIDSAYGTEPVGQIGVHYPREIVRIERDYAGGELVQFQPTYPLELDGRITPTQFLETINGINEMLISAHSLKRSFLDNTLALCTLYLSLLVVDTHYERTMRKLAQFIDRLNLELYNPRGLNILWPRKSAFMFLEIEYYVSRVRLSYLTKIDRDPPQ